MSHAARRSRRVWALASVSSRERQARLSEEGVDYGCATRNSFVHGQMARIQSILYSSFQLLILACFPHFGDDCRWARLETSRLAGAGRNTDGHQSREVGRAHTFTPRRVACSPADRPRAKPAAPGGAGTRGLRALRSAPAAGRARAPGGRARERAGEDGGADGGWRGVAEGPAGLSGVPMASRARQVGRPLPVCGVLQLESGSGCWSFESCACLLFHSPIRENQRSRTSYDMISNFC